MKKTILLLIAFTSIFLQGKAQTVSANPNNGRNLDRLNVKITGINTSFNAGSNTLQFFRNGTSTNFLKVDGLTPISATEMDVDLFIQASATLGNYSFIVSNPIFGNASSTNFFIVRPDTGTAKIASLTPSRIPLGYQSFRVLLSADNTHFYQASNTQITFFKNGSPTNEVSGTFEKIDNNRLVYLVINHISSAFGNYDLELRNNFETIYKSDALSVLPSIGIKETNEASEKLKVYPNPAKENLHIQTTQNNIEEISVYDLTGALVQTETPNLPKKNITLKLSDMLISKQIYMLRIKTKSGVYYHKIQID